MFLKILLLGLAIKRSASSEFNDEYNTVRYDDYKVIQMTPQTTQALQALFKMQKSNMSGFDFWSNVGLIGMPVSVMIPPQKLKEVHDMEKKVGLKTNVMVDNVQRNIDREMIAPRRFDGLSWYSYPKPKQIYDWLISLPTDYPGIVQLIQLNSTYEGRPIIGVKLTFDNTKMKKAIFLESNIHAREWITSAATTYILNELLTSTDTSVRYFAESYNWYIFPIANPDGFEYSHIKDRMWKKTRVPYTPLCSGADPNRNWGYLWHQTGNTSPCSNDYNGPRAFSEPCTKILSDFISTIGSELEGYLSFHTGGQLLLIPLDYMHNQAQDYGLSYSIGLKAVKALAKRYGTVYKIGRVYDTIYQSTGSSTDWVKGVLKVPMVYTYNLRDLGYGFLLPPEQIVPTAEEVLDSIMAMFKEYRESQKGMSGSH